MPQINSVSSSFSAANSTVAEVSQKSSNTAASLQLPAEIKVDLGKPTNEPKVLRDLYQKIADKLAPGIFNPNTTDQGTVKFKPAEVNDLFNSSLKALGDVPLSSLSADEQQFFNRATGKTLDAAKTTVKDAITSALGNQVNEFRKNHPGVAEAAVFAYIAATKDVSVLNKLGVLPAKLEVNSSQTVKDANGSIATNQNLFGQLSLEQNNKFNLSAGYKREEVWNKFNVAAGKTGFEIKALDVLNNPNLQADFNTEQTNNLSNGTYKTDFSAQLQASRKNGAALDLKGGTESLSIVKKDGQTTTLTEKFTGQINGDSKGTLNLQAGFNRKEVRQNEQSARQIETNASIKAENLLVSPKLNANAGYNQIVTSKNGNSDSISVSGGFQTGAGKTAAQLQAEAKSTRIVTDQNQKTTINTAINGQIDFNDNKLNALGQYNRQKIVRLGDKTLDSNNLNLSAKASDLLGAPKVQLNGRYEQKSGDESFFIGGQAQVIPTPELQKVEAGYQKGALTVGAEYTPQNGISGSIGVQGKLYNGGKQETGSYFGKLEANQKEIKALFGLQAKF